MNHRFWFYSASLIVIAALSIWYIGHRRQLSAETNRIEGESVKEARVALDQYLSQQADGAKLVGLAKLVSKSRPELVKPIILRAFELNPDNRDIVILASNYSEEAKKRLKVVDPLYKPDSSRTNQ